MAPHSSTLAWSIWGFLNLRFLFDADHFKSIIEIILILLLFYIFVFVAGRHVGS